MKGLAVIALHLNLGYVKAMGEMDKDKQVEILMDAAKQAVDDLYENMEYDIDQIEKEIKKYNNKEENDNGTAGRKAG